MKENKISASYWLFKKAYEKSEPDGISDDIYYIRIVHGNGSPIWVTGYVNEFGMITRVGLAITQLEHDQLEKHFQLSEKIDREQPLVDIILRMDGGKTFEERITA